MSATLEANVCSRLYQTARNAAATQSAVGMHILKKVCLNTGLSMTAGPLVCGRIQNTKPFSILKRLLTCK